MNPAFTAGYHAGYRGDMNNPHTPGTQDYKDWWVGYEEARLDIRAGR